MRTLELESVSVIRRVKDCIAEISSLKYGLRPLFRCACEMPNVSIRPAQQSDRKTVFKFCEQTFDWGDYVPNVWDVWLRDEKAKLFTATLDNKPVGIMRVSMQKAGEAWLQAARTDPSYRRIGVATALTNACLNWAERKGAKIARLGTDSDNHVAQRAFEKFGFTQISDFLIMKCENLRAEKAENSRWARERDIKKTWRFLSHSEIFAESASLYTILFVWASLGKQSLAGFITSKNAILYRSNGTVTGLVLIDKTVRDVWREKPFQTCYIDGNHQAIVDMMKFFKDYSYRRGVAKVYAFAYNTPSIANALSSAGFSREEPTTELIYERRMTQ